VVERIDERRDYGESRIVTTGEVDGRCFHLARNGSPYHLSTKGQFA
jgi:hypothetical protein